MGRTETGLKPSHTANANSLPVASGHAFWSALEEKLHRILHGSPPTHLFSGTQALVAIALVIGALTGIGSAIFRRLTLSISHFAFGGIDFEAPWISKALYIPIPIVGILLSALIVNRFCREARGHGVPEVMQAVALQNGRIRSRVSVIKTLVSALTIGFGGSVGMEGPIVQIGSSIGSSAAQGMKMSTDRTRALVACGAAGGIAAIFNTPIAGVIFALEVILDNFTASAFSLVVISAVSSSVTSHFLMGDERIFNLPAYGLNGPHELPFYMLMGAGAAFAAKAFVKSIYWMEDLFERWKWPDGAKAVAGGLAMGLIGMTFHQTLGGYGYAAIEDAALEKIGVGLMLALLFAKIAATGITLAAGGSGGVFAPALFVGAMFGGACGYGTRLFFPGTEIGAFAMVGMSAVFAAAAHAPITSILMIFEMTNNYHIILPLMFATVISSLVGGRILPDSIYALKLKRRGVNLRKGMNQDVMSRIPVETAMTVELETLQDDATVRQAARRMVESEHTGFPVLNGKGELAGIITYSDVHKLRDQGMLHVPIRNLKEKPLIVTYPDETLRDALSRMTLRDVGRLPVVDRENPKKLLGIVTRTNILAAYQKTSIIDVQPGSFTIE